MWVNKLPNGTYGLRRILLIQNTVWSVSKCYAAIALFSHVMWWKAFNIFV